MPNMSSSQGAKAVLAKANNPDQYFSRAVEKAFQALDCVDKSGQPLALHQIAANLGLTKASAFRILYTLETLGYLKKSADGRYTTAARTNAQMPSRLVNELLRHGAVPLEQLSLEFRETASLAALFENHIEVLAVVESPHIMRMGNTPGRILPPYASSLGKVITAFQTDEVREKLIRSYGLASFTPNTITDEIALRTEFNQIRAQGYAEDREESTPGGCCFAAPILRKGGFAIGAVSLSMPLIRFQGDEHRREVVAALQRAALAVQEQLAGG
jgi:IclR family acetate operon transcriptional repressor